MHHAFDWQPFVKQHWEKAPARLALPGPILPVDQVFQAAISACAPFRHGTRFRALPDARFFVEAARLAAPGTLLPGEDDASLESFSRRASKHLDGASFQLHVEQPFMFDFALWSALRDFLRGLLERVGVPVLPMATDLLLGRFSRGPYGIAKRPHHSLVTLVLQGRLRVRLWKKLWGSPPTKPRTSTATWTRPPPWRPVPVSCSTAPLATGSSKKPRGTAWPSGYGFPSRGAGPRTRPRTCSWGSSKRGTRTMSACPTTPTPGAGHARAHRPPFHPSSRPRIRSTR